MRLQEQGWQQIQLYRLVTKLCTIVFGFFLSSQMYCIQH